MQEPQPRQADIGDDSIRSLNLKASEVQPYWRKEESASCREELTDWYERKIDGLSSFIFQHFTTIKLSSKYQLIWNLVNYIVIYYAFISNLFTIFIVSVWEFKIATTQPFHRASKYSMLLVILVDFFFIRWRVEDLGRLEWKRINHEAFKKWIAYYFVVDLIVIVIVLMDVAQFRFGYWKVLIYLKVFQFINIIDQIEAEIYGHKIYQIIYTALKLLFFVVFWSFFFACVFVTIELQLIKQNGFDYQNGFVWLVSHPSVDYLNLYENFQWYVWFEYALFFVLQMVRGAGMGICSPRSPASMLWYNVSNVTMTVLFWFFTDKVLWFVGQYKQKQRLAEQVLSLKQMQDIRNFSEKKYQNYECFLKMRSKTSAEAVEWQKEILSMLPLYLKKQFTCDLKQHFIMRLRCLNVFSYPDDQRLERNLKKEISQIIGTRVLYMGQVVKRRNKISQERLYLSEQSHFIRSNGPLEYAERLEEWSFVGVREFFIDRRSLFDVVASRIVSVDYIDKEDFRAVLKRFPRVYDSYCQRVDAIKIERQSTETIELRCWHCAGFHLSEDCRKLPFHRETLLAWLALNKQCFLLSDDCVESGQMVRRRRDRKELNSNKYRKLCMLGYDYEVDGYKHKQFNFQEYNIEVLEYQKREPYTMTRYEMKQMQIPNNQSNEAISLIL